MRPILEVQHLQKHFPIRKGFFRREVGQAQAVNNVGFDLYAGETLGVVGESGCGKSTLARLITRLIRPTDGSVNVALDGTELDAYRTGEHDLVDIAKVPRRLLRGFRSQVQMVFQDPYLSLNPRLTIGSSIEEVMKIQGASSSARRKEKVGELLNDVGLRADMVGRFPHEFSGGQRQRASLARALAANPGILVADEPVSALDVSVQAQIIKLLIDLQKKYELAMIFISHDLSVVKYISDKVAVMYLGEIVEAGPASAIFRSPRHPYTEALMKSVPRIGVPVDDIDPIVGEIPSNISPPSGCKFNPRCRYRQDICSARNPDGPSDMSVHYARCHFADKLKLEGI